MKVTDWAQNKSPADYYQKLRSKDSILLESLVNSTPDSRYSYIALNPDRVFKCKGGKTWVNNRYVEGNPFEILQKLMPEYRRREENIPLFSSGCVGYFGYDFKNVIEPKLSTKAKDDLNFWDAYMIFPRTIIAFDHKEGTIITFGEDVGQIEISSQVNESDYVLMSNMDYDKYAQMVRKAREYVLDGDSYQIKVSQRLEINVEESFELYQAARMLDPTPYAAYAQFEGIEIVCLSPEELLKVENRVATTRPIGGTYPRGRTLEEDKQLVQQFFQDEKEIAEHVMLIDLERNDLGRFCKPGSVNVERMMEHEQYENVNHIVTTISGEMKNEVTSFDAFASMFPGGTISGCPKIRTMEIIDELEPTSRGPYSGSLGFITNSDDCQFNILIRSMFVKDGRGYLQLGGGIVADSVVEREYEETLHKGRTFLDAQSLLKKRDKEIHGNQIKERFRTSVK